MKVDSSQKGLKRFFLFHGEKLIVGLGIVVMAVFFWLGYSTQTYKEKSPGELAKMAESAKQHIINPASWDTIREHEARQSELDLLEKIIEGNKGIDLEAYPFGPWSIRAKTLQRRKDPLLLSPKDFVTDQIQALVSVDITQARSRPEDVLSDQPLAGSPMTSSTGRPGGARPDRGDPGLLSGESSGDGAGGGTLNDPGGSAHSEEHFALLGTEVKVLHQLTQPGVRPTHYGMTPAVQAPILSNVVSVAGLVNFKQQFEEFQKSFLDGIGYFPDRDRPNYKFLQVERRLKNGDDWGPWIDISQEIEKGKELIPPSLLRLPEAEFPSAPEVVHPDYFDPLLTAPIPGLLGFDYVNLVRHPQVPLRIFDPLPREQDDKQEFNRADLFRVRANEPEPATAEDKPLIRSGSESAQYAKVLEAKKPSKDFKLVRFFDFNAKPGETYQYRVRPWLFDPNQDYVDGASFARRPGAGAPGGPGGGRRGAPGVFGDEGAGAGAGQGAGAADPRGGGGARRGGPGGRDRGRPGGDVGGRGGAAGQPDGDPDSGEEEFYEYVDITPQMKDPLVRSRLTAAEEAPDPNDPENIDKFSYFIYEDGYEELIQIPKDLEWKLLGCRPTQWSETFEVTVKQRQSEVVGGAIETGRNIRVGKFDIPENEPVAELVVNVWNSVYKSFLPGRKMAYRGEALEFSFNAHVLHPISWRVYRVENAPIVSASVLVDVLGGNELETPNSEPMRFHTAREMLIMNSDGSFSITNDMDDRTRYKQLLLQADDSMEVGKRKTPPPSTESVPPRGGRGGRDGFDF